MVPGVRGGIGLAILCVVPLWLAIAARHGIANAPTVYEHRKQRPLSGLSRRRTGKFRRNAGHTPRFPTRTTCTSLAAATASEPSMSCTCSRRRHRPKHRHGTRWRFVVCCGSGAWIVDGKMLMMFSFGSAHGAWPCLTVSCLYRLQVVSAREPRLSDPILPCLDDCPARTGRQRVTFRRREATTAEHWWVTTLPSLAALTASTALPTSTFSISSRWCGQRPSLVWAGWRRFCCVSPTVAVVCRLPRHAGRVCRFNLNI